MDYSDSPTSESPNPEFPLRAFLGFEIEASDGTAVTSLLLGERHMNPNNIAHGAVSFALMDTAMGGAVVSVLREGQTCATVEMHTRFHRPAAAGRLTATAKVLTAGRRMVHVEAKTIDDQGRLVASATSSFAVINPQT